MGLKQEARTTERAWRQGRWAGTEYQEVPL